MSAAVPLSATFPDDVLEFAYASPGTDVLGAYERSGQDCR